MSYLAAMTLPALVVILVVAGAIEALLVRRRRRRGDTEARQHVASIGFDALGLALAPTTKNRIEHDEYLQLKREEDAEGAPPRSHVDLDSGTARIVVPRADEGGRAPSE